MEKIHPGHTTLQLLREIHRSMTENRIQPEQFEDRIIFISMSNDIHWTKDGNEERVLRILPMLLRTPEDFLQDICHSSDQELKNNCMERTLTSKTVCDHSAEIMMFHIRTKGTSYIANDKFVRPRIFE